MVGPDNNKNAEDEAPTVRLPETHTALLRHSDTLSRQRMGSNR